MGPPETGVQFHAIPLSGPIASGGFPKLRLGGRPKVRLFLRFDRFDRFVSALLFAPRDHVNALVRSRIHALLAQALNGRTSSSDVAIDETDDLGINWAVDGVGRY